MNVIFAPPATGKTHYCKRVNTNTLDEVMFGDMKSLRGLVDSHAKFTGCEPTVVLGIESRSVEELASDPFVSVKLVYPSRDMKEEYRQRFINRGNDMYGWAKEILHRWDEMIDYCEKVEGVEKIQLTKGQYLTDVL